MTVACQHCGAANPAPAVGKPLGIQLCMSCGKETGARTATAATRFVVSATVRTNPIDCDRCGKTLADGAPVFVGTHGPSHTSFPVDVTVGMCCFEAEHRMVYRAHPEVRP